MQLPFNLLDHRWPPTTVTGRASRRGRTSSSPCRSAYLQGLLVSARGRVAAATRDSSRPTWPRASAGWSASWGATSAADLCLAWVLGHPWVTSVVVGAETADQVRDSARLARQTTR